MADFYAEMADVATEVLAEFKTGTPKLLRPGANTPGSETWDKPTQAAPTEYDLDATVLPIQSDKASAKYIDGKTILGSDLVVTCAVPEVEPAVTDMVLVGSKQASIKKIIRIPEVGSAVAFKLIIQR